MVGLVYWEDLNLRAKHNDRTRKLGISTLPQLDPIGHGYGTCSKTAVESVRKSS